MTSTVKKKRVQAKKRIFVSACNIHSTAPSVCLRKKKTKRCVKFSGRNESNVRLLILKKYSKSLPQLVDEWEFWLGVVLV